MPVVEFKNSRNLRKRVRPQLSLREMCRKMGVSPTYLSFLERGRTRWPDWRKDEYLRIIEDWEKSPSPKERKKRTTKPKLSEPVRVPHPNGRSAMIKQLAHLCFKTIQLDRMTAFYRNVLGATVKFRFLNRAGQPIGCYFAFGEKTFVEVFDHADAHRRSQSSKPLEPLEEPRDPWLMHYNHFCLQVENLDDYVKLIASRGATVTGRKIGNDHSHQAWIRDPDGNLIELQEYTAQSRQFTGEDFREV